MADNPFDQFDAAGQSGNPFDQFDEKPKAANPEVKNNPLVVSPTDAIAQTMGDVGQKGMDMARTAVASSIDAARGLPQAAGALIDPTALGRAAATGWNATTHITHLPTIDTTPTRLDYTLQTPSRLMTDYLNGHTKGYQDFMGDVRDAVTAGITPQFQSAANKDIKHGITDPDWYLSNIAGMVPYIAGDLGLVKATSRMAYLSKLTQIADEAMPVSAKMAVATDHAQKVGAAIGSLSAGAVMGGTTGQQVRDTLNGLPETTLMNYPDYRALRQQGKTDAEARDLWLQNRANQATLLAAVASELPAKAVNNYVAHAAMGRRIAGSLAGAVARGGVEAGVAGGLGMGGMAAATQAETASNPDLVDALKKSGDQALTGALLGTITGGLTAGIAHPLIKTPEAVRLANTDLGDREALKAAAVAKQQADIDARAAEAAKKPVERGPEPAPPPEKTTEPTQHELDLVQHDLLEKRNAFVQSHQRVQELQAAADDPHIPVSYNDLERARRDRVTAFENFRQAATDAGILGEEHGGTKTEGPDGNRQRQAGAESNGVPGLDEHGARGVLQAGRERQRSLGEDRGSDDERVQQANGVTQPVGEGHNEVGEREGVLRRRGVNGLGDREPNGNLPESGENGRNRQEGAAAEREPLPTQAGRAGAVEGQEHAERGVERENLELPQHEEVALGGPLMPESERNTALKTGAVGATEEQPSSPADRKKLKVILKKPVANDKQYGANLASIPRNDKLTPEAKRVEHRLAATVADVPAAERAYAAIPGSEGGRVINTDLARELSPDYNKDDKSRAEHANAVQEPSSWLADKLYDRRLAEPKRGNGDVLFTGGGSDSGKSVSLKSEDARKADIVYDGNLNTIQKARRRIKAALDSGRNVKIQFSYRDPIDAWRNGVLPRALKFGRTVPAEAHAATHNGAFKVVTQLAKQFEHDKRVQIGFIDTSELKPTTLKDIAHKHYDVTPDELRKIAVEEYKRGNITEEILRGVGGESAVRMAHRGEDHGRTPGERVAGRGREASAGAEAQARAEGHPGREGGNREGARPQAGLEQGVPSEVHAPLEGMPTKVEVPGHGEVEFGPLPIAQKAAEDYAREAGIPYRRPTKYLKTDKEIGKRIADAYDAMKHDPTNPLVKASYDALIRETIAQWHAIEKTGLKIEWIKPGEDPYKASPRLAIMDVRDNNHLWVFPTEGGYGQGEGITEHPMLAPTDLVVGGKKLLANDVFRIVHDYFGHIKEGNGFRADGELNAWNIHRGMYSEAAQGALASETLGQNSWVNWGPKGEKNRTASGADTIYAEQKAGLLPGNLWQSQRFSVDKTRGGVRETSWSPTEARPGGQTEVEIRAEAATDNGRRGASAREQLEEFLGINRQMEFRHFSNLNDESVILDPSFYGTGTRGAERERIAAGSPKVISAYRVGGEVEPALRGKTEYSIKVPRSHMYDLSRDPLGITEKAVNPGGSYDHTKAEQLIKKAGFAGYYLSEGNGIFKGQARFFGKVEAHRVANEREMARRWYGDPSNVAYATKDDVEGIKAGGIDKATQDRVVARVRRELGHDIKFVDKPEDIIQDQWAAQNLPVTGVFTQTPDGGEVHLIAGNLGSEEHAVTTAYHEIVGHMGLQGVLGGSDSPHYNRVMDQIATAFPTVLDSVARRNGINLADGTIARRRAAEEIVAYAAQVHAPRGRPPIFHRIVAMVRDALRKIGLVRSMSARDVGSLIDRAAEYARRGGVQRALARDIVKQAIRGALPRVPPVVRHSVDGGVHEFETPHSYMLGQEGDSTLQLKLSHVDDNVRNQGFGMAMMTRAAEEAHARGLTLTSDVTVSPDAQHLYDALERRGYTVVRNPADVNPVTGSLLSKDPRVPVYEVHPAQRFAVRKPQAEEVRDIISPIAAHLTDKERSSMNRASARRVVALFNELPGVEENAAMALAGIAKRGWYRQAGEAITNLFGPDAPRFTGLLAALSPRQQVNPNLRQAISVFHAWHAAGRPTDRKSLEKIIRSGTGKLFGAHVPNIIRALTDKDPEKLALSGPKVDSFYRNLMRDVHAVTLDSWMATGAGVPQKLFSGAEKGGIKQATAGYIAYSARVREAADYLTKLTGETWTPEEVQETIWSWLKTAHEEAGPLGGIDELVRNGEITDKLVGATPDFATLITGPEHESALRSLGLGGRLDELRRQQASAAQPGTPSEATQAAREALSPALLKSARRLEDARQARENNQNLAVGGPSQNADMESFLSKIGPSGPRWQDRVKTTIKNLRHEAEIAVQQFYGIEKAWREAGKEGPNLGYMSARLSHNGSALMSYVMYHGQPIWNGGVPDVKPGSVGFVDIMRPLGPKAKDFMAAVVARRASRLMEEGREHNFTQEEINAGNLLWKENPEFEEAYKHFADFKRGILDFAQQAGIINADTRPMWEHDDYIPFYRVMNANAEVLGPGAGGALGRVRKQIHQLTGGTAPIGDPLENIIRNWDSLIKASLRNQAGTLTIDGLRDTGIVEPARTPNASMITKSAFAEGLRAFGVNPDVIPSEALQDLHERHNVQPEDDHHIWIWRNGQKEHWKVNDPFLFRSLSELNTQGRSAILEGAKAILGLPARVLRTGIVNSPVFAVKILMRHNQMAFVAGAAGDKTLSPGFIPGWDTAKGFGAMIRGTPEAVSLGAAGGTFQGAHDYANYFNASKRVQRELAAPSVSGTIVKSAKDLASFYFKVLNASEGANRIAIANHIGNRGGSRLEQAYAARNLLDYTSAGANPILQFMCSVIPFTKAHVAGLYMLGKRAAENPRGFALRGSLLAAAAVAYAAANNSNQRYQELPDDQKTGYFHFFDVFTPGDHWQIPKSFEDGAIFATIPEAVTNGLMSGEPDRWSQSAGLAGHALLQAFAYDVMPTAVRPAFDLAINKQHWSGAPVLSQRDLEVNPQSQDAPYVAPTYRFVARGMPEAAPDILKSPKQLQFLARGYLGTLGDYATDITDIAARQFLGEPKLPGRGPIQDLPGASQIGTTGPARRTRYTDSMYTISKQIADDYNSVQAAARAGDAARVRTEVQQYRPLLNVREYYGEATRQVAQLRKAQTAIETNKTLSVDDKRERMDKLQTEINAIAEKVYQLRPGGKLNPTTATKLIGATKPQAVNILLRAGLPATAGILQTSTQELAA